MLIGGPGVQVVKGVNTNEVERKERRNTEDKVRSRFVHLNESTFVFHFLIICVENPDNKDLILPLEQVQKSSSNSV